MTHTLHIIRRPRRVQVNLPVPWLERVAELPGKALHVGTALLYLAALRQSPEVRFSQATLRRFHTSRDASYDALRRMSAAGLVRVSKTPGCSPTVTLVEPDGQVLAVHCAHG
jgi:hypothetical protein